MIAERPCSEIYRCAGIRRNFEELPLIRNELDPSVRMSSLWISECMPDLPGNPVTFDLSSMSKAQRMHFAEQQYLPETAMKTGTLFLETQQHYTILAGAQDHVCITVELGENSTDKLTDICKTIGEKHPFSRHPVFGYLTKSPMEAGTGFFCKALLHLPALEAGNEIDLHREGAKKDGFVIEPYISGVKGFYILRNNVTFGKTVDEICQGFDFWLGKLETTEENSSQNVDEPKVLKMRDEAFRALGTLRYAKALPFEEFLTCIGKIRNGAIRSWLPLRLSQCVEICRVGSRSNVMSARTADDADESVIRANLLERVMKRILEDT